MKTKTARLERGKQAADGVSPQYRRIAGRRMVVLHESEYTRLKQKADEWEPRLPDPFPDGNYPALEYMRVSLALKIIRDRRKVGLTQAELARRAGVRLATLVRIEQGNHSPSVATVEKIDRALTVAEAEGID